MFALLIYLTVFVVATCGLIYEFVAGTLASYLLGGSLTHFSIVIGLFLTALGAGAYLSRAVEHEVERKFIDVELATALVGGLSAPLLFVTFARPWTFLAALYVVVLLEGTLVGLEIPLLLRMLKRRVQFRDLVSRALAFDYVGSLAAGVLFSLLLLPYLGLLRAALVAALINAIVGLGATWLFGSSLRNPRRMRIKAALVIGTLSVAFAASETLTRATESLLFTDPIIYAKQTRFQRIVMTSGRGGFHLFLDGNLQFSSLDEYRYHEALVHPAMLSAAKRSQVLILGGGDGLAAREVLRYPDVQAVTLVDIDPEMTRLATTNPALSKLNQNSLRDERVRVVNDDAMAWLTEGTSQFDVVIIDFPDPNNYALGKLYTTHFYRLVKPRLRDDGALVVQATSPLLARQSYWCVVSTLEASGLRTRPYHAFVPSFGEWGYVLAGKHDVQPSQQLPPGLRYLQPASLPTLFVFTPDMDRIDSEVNRLGSQVLVRYYDAEWRRLL